MGIWKQEFYYPENFSQYFGLSVFSHFFQHTPSGRLSRCTWGVFLLNNTSGTWGTWLGVLGCFQSTHLAYSCLHLAQAPVRQVMDRPLSPEPAKIKSISPGPWQWNMWFHIVVHNMTRLEGVLKTFGYHLVTCTVYSDFMIQDIRGLGVIGGQVLHLYSSLCIGWRLQPLCLSPKQQPSLYQQ